MFLLPSWLHPVVGGCWLCQVVSDTHLEFQGFLAEMQGLLGLCFGLWLWLLASLSENCSGDTVAKHGKAIKKRHEAVQCELSSSCIQIDALL